MIFFSSNTLYESYQSLSWILCYNNNLSNTNWLNVIMFYLIFDIISHFISKSRSFHRFIHDFWQPKRVKNCHNQDDIWDFDTIKMVFGGFDIVTTTFSDFERKKKIIWYCLFWKFQSSSKRFQMERSRKRYVWKLKNSFEMK